MKYFKLKHPVSFPITACWGITATKYAVIIYLGLRGFVIELPQRKLTKRSPDSPYVCLHCGAHASSDHLPWCKSLPQNGGR